MITLTPLLGTSISIEYGTPLLLALFLLLQAILAYRLWGGAVAATAVLLSLLPGSLTIWTATQPQANAFGYLLICGTAALILSQWPIEIENEWLNNSRLLLVGILFGVGFFASQMTLIYTAVILLLWLLRSPEWRQIHHLLAPVMWVLLTLFLSGLSLATFLTSYCQAPAVYLQMGIVAQILLLAAIGWFAIGVLYASTRQEFLLRGLLIITFGTVIGGLFQWQQMAGANPLPLQTTCPADLLAQATHLLTQQLPQLWGMATLNTSSGGWFWLQALLFLPTLLITSLSLIYFWWHWRYILVALLALRPAVDDDVKILLTGALFFIPFLLALFSPIRPQIGAATRYLLIAWQSASMMVGWVIIHLAQPRYTKAALAFTTILLLQLLLGYYTVIISG